MHRKVLARTVTMRTEGTDALAVPLQWHDRVPEAASMSPLRFLVAIPRLVHIRRLSHCDLWVSEDWLAEHRAKGFDIGRRREVPAHLSTLVSEAQLEGSRGRLTGSAGARPPFAHKSNPEKRRRHLRPGR